ncbi:hypothetical protein ABS71_05500 [bacterium SCN 62-11]|nr:hypothetical protein [Candidatus Eremiobacteraeota bacterium]ODT74563.1 MAG: hypothetical protein ABS71_05500 [bacterium SCN 62-11]
MSTPVATFEHGTLVYEPFLGLCQITNSSRETMLGVEQLFYEMQPRQGTAVVKVPAGQMTSRGIRPLMTTDEIEKALHTNSPSAPTTSNETYPQRIKRWTALLRSKQNFGGYEFLLEWQQLSTQGVRLSAQESELHGKIQRSLAQEIAEVLQISAESAAGKINEWLESK